MQRTLEKQRQVHIFHKLTQSWERSLASLSRKTILRRSGELYRTGRMLFHILARKFKCAEAHWFSPKQERYTLAVIPIIQEKVSPLSQKHPQDFQLFRPSLL